jgi:hypothetical protein
VKGKYVIQFTVVADNGEKEMYVNEGDKRTEGIG